MTMKELYKETEEILHRDNSLDMDDGVFLSALCLACEKSRRIQYREHRWLDKEYFAHPTADNCRVLSFSRGA